MPSTICVSPIGAFGGSCWAMPRGRSLPPRISIRNVRGSARSNANSTPRPTSARSLRPPTRPVYVPDPPRSAADTSGRGHGSGPARPPENSPPPLLRPAVRRSRSHSQFAGPAPRSAGPEVRPSHAILTHRQPHRSSRPRRLTGQRIPPRPHWARTSRLARASCRRPFALATRSIQRSSTAATPHPKVADRSAISAKKALVIRYSVTATVIGHGHHWRAT